MRNEGSHLMSGMLFGALIGACATYLIIKNKGTIKRELEEVSEKVKYGVHEFGHKAKEKAEEFGERAKEKANAYGETAYEKANKTAASSDYKSQNLNNPSTGKTY